MLPSHLLTKLTNLALLALDHGEQAPAGGGPERAARAPGPRRGCKGRRAKPAARVDDHGLHGTRNRTAVHPLKPGSVLLAAGADADLAGLSGHARVGDVDVVRSGCQLVAGAGAEREVVGACLVVEERLEPGGKVVVSGGVVAEGVNARGDAVVRGGVLTERVEAGGDVVGPGAVDKERKWASRDVVSAGGVLFERVEAGGDVLIAGGVEAEWSLFIMFRLL